MELNYNIIGYTKKNLSPIYAIGLADYGDYRFKFNLVASISGSFYRPLFIGEEYYTDENLPNEFKFILSRNVFLSDESKELISVINKEFSTQTPSIVNYIKVYFNFFRKIHATAIHNISFPLEYNSIAYIAMSDALIEYNEKLRYEKQLNETRVKLSNLHIEYRKLKENVFNKFYVGKLGKRQSTVNKQIDNFFQKI
jgi:hypothetical protein